MGMANSTGVDDLPLPNFQRPFPRTMKPSRPKRCVVARRNQKRIELRQRCKTNAKSENLVVQNPEVKNSSVDPERRCEGYPRKCESRTP